MEEEQQNENCNNDDVQEQSLNGSRVSEEIGHVSFEDFSELKGHANLSFSCNF